MEDKLHKQHCLYRGLSWIPTDSHSRITQESVGIQPQESVGIQLRPLGNAAYVVCLPLLCQGSKLLNGKIVWLVLRRSWVQIPAGSRTFSVDHSHSTKKKFGAPTTLSSPATPLSPLTVTHEAIFSLTWHHTFNIRTYKLCVLSALLRFRLIITRGVKACLAIHDW